MSPDAPTTAADFALLASGANFSCEVLQALIDRAYLPELLVLPEYPPAPKPATNHGSLVTAVPERRLLELAQGIEIAHVPAREQAVFARRIERQQIAFLLVACWPYLIEPGLIESAAKATLNLHPSMLPSYRGPNPLARQWATGDFSFGVSLHLLNQRFDQGDIIAQAGLADNGEQPCRSIIERRCARQGVELFITAVERYPNWNPVAQVP